MVERFYVFLRLEFSNLATSSSSIFIFVNYIEMISIFSFNYLSTFENYGKSESDLFVLSRREEKRKGNQKFLFEFFVTRRDIVPNFQFQKV